MSPENGRARPAENGTGSETNDQLAGDQSNGNPDLAVVAEGAWEALAGLLLTSPPVERARELLADVPPKAPDPSIEWWINATRVCAESLTICNPLTAVSGSSVPGAGSFSGLGARLEGGLGPVRLRRALRGHCSS